MRVTGLESCMQKHEREARDSGYTYMALHATINDRKWRRMVVNLRPLEEKLVELAAKARRVLAFGS